MEKVYVCESCGETAGLDDQYCNRCGSEFMDKVNKDTRESDQRVIFKNEYIDVKIKDLKKLLPILKANKIKYELDLPF